MNEKIISEITDPKYLTHYKYVVKDNNSVLKKYSVTAQRRQAVEANLSNPRKEKP